MLPGNGRVGGWVFLLGMEPGMEGTHLRHLLEAFPKQAIKRLQSSTKGKAVTEIRLELERPQGSGCRLSL
jgi:hypothetical protein